MNDGHIGEKTAVFKDLAISFKAHPLTGEPVRVLNYNAINQAFKNIIYINKKERPFDNIRFGSSIKSKLFEVFTPTLERDIREELQRDILNVDDRVIIKSISVNNQQDNSVYIKIEYKIRTFDQSTTFEMFLERI